MKELFVTSSSVSCDLNTMLSSYTRRPRPLSIVTAFVFGSVCWAAVLVLSACVSVLSDRLKADLSENPTLPTCS